MNIIHEVTGFMKMDGGAKRMYLQENIGLKSVIMKGGGGDDDSVSMDSASTYSTSFLSSLSDLTESSNVSLNNGPLYQLADLMAQLPIKRGLSKNYEGKSRSFTCLQNVKSIEDVPKRECCNKMKMKTRKRYYGPKPLISKKSSKKRHKL